MYRLLLASEEEFRERVVRAIEPNASFVETATFFGRDLPDNLRPAPALTTGKLARHQHRKRQVPVWLCEGSTENATLARTLLADLVDRGLDPDQAILFVIDGGKALRRPAQDSLQASSSVG